MNRLSVEIFNPDPPRLVPDTEKITNALKNNVLHPIDLLVRETIQNSIDAAARPNERAKDVRVEFKRGDFDIDGFTGCMDRECGNQLKKYLSRHKKPSRYFAIRDSNCVGLTGDPRDRKSNVYKLIYGFLDGKGSAASDGFQGGSFGVGKTVFLRFGIGFVIYYSRTADGTSRLSMFYCRNGRGDMIFPDMPYQLAWWGQVANGSRAAFPIEDEDFIERFLSVFGLTPYRERETGATIVIPFFDESVPNEESPGFKPWEKGFDEYLRYSVLKWYAPRYRADLKSRANETGEDFRSYRWGPYLRCAFPDGEPVSEATISKSEHQLFGLIRDLYDVAVGERAESYRFNRIEVTSSDYPRYDVYFDDTTIGWFAVTKINYASGDFADALPLLNALAPEGEIKDRKGFALYCRRPGMVMTYDDGWDKVFSGAQAEPGEFYIGIFAVNSNCNVYADHGLGKLLGPLDMLFRETENTDHYGWPTTAVSRKIGLIKKIVNNLRRDVADLFGESEALPETTPKGDIARGLGCVFQEGRDGFGGSQLFPEGNGGIDEESPRSEGTGTRRKRTARANFQRNGWVFSVLRLAA